MSELQLTPELRRELRLAIDARRRELLRDEPQARVGGYTRRSANLADHPQRCRCGPCTAARERCGTVYSYRRGCRCLLCRLAVVDAKAAYRQRARSEAAGAA